jgi:hypothetical protein
VIASNDRIDWEGASLIAMDLKLGGADVSLAGDHFRPSELAMCSSIS